jgi:hypothetical protein
LAAGWKSSTTVSVGSCAAGQSSDLARLRDPALTERAARKRTPLLQPVPGLASRAAPLTRVQIQLTCHRRPERVGALHNDHNGRADLARRLMLAHRRPVLEMIHGSHI